LLVPLGQLLVPGVSGKTASRGDVFARAKIPSFPRRSQPEGIGKILGLVYRHPVLVDHVLNAPPDLAR